MVVSRAICMGLVAAPSPVDALFDTHAILDCE